MFKSIIYKYFFSEVAKSFFIVLFTFTAIAWTVRAVNFLDLVIENTLNFKTYFFYSLLYSTNIVTKFMPLALLLSIIGRNRSYTSEINWGFDIFLVIFTFYFCDC